MSRNLKDTNGKLILFSASLVALLFLISPVAVLYDVLHNHRSPSDIADSHLPFAYGLAHFGYLIGCAIAGCLVCISLLNRDASKADKTTRHRHGRIFLGFASITYLSPLIWLIFRVPGYWKALIAMIWNLLA